MNENEKKDLINFITELKNLTTKFADKVPAYELVNQLICHGCCISLGCAPNELIGVKTVLASVENGINEYERTYS